MSNFFNKCYKVVVAILIALFFCITIVSAFYGLDQNLSPVIVIIGVIVAFFLFKYIYKKLDKLSDKKIKWIAIILSILFFVGLLLVGIFLPISSVTDLSHIIEYANRMISENSLTITGSYFSKYTNQIPLLIFVYGFANVGSIFGCTNVLLMGTIFNSLLMALTTYFIYLIGKEIHSPKAGLLSLIFMIINPVFYLYSSYFYTDTLCMPFAIIGLYLLIKCMKANNSKNKILLGILSGLIFFIGLKVRIVVAILLIASCAYILINKKVTHKLSIYLSLALGLVIGIFGFKLVYNHFDINLDENAEFPITHWIMMGLNEDYTGGYNGGDHDLTFNEPTKEEKQEKNIEVIKERLSDLGLFGIIKLEGTKIARTWASGNYGVYAKLNNTADGTGLYEYLGGYGNTNIFMKYSLQILKTYISLMILIGLYQAFKRKEIEYKEDAIIYIALFGAILFYIIWEAAQRYSLSFLPWMIIPLGLIYANMSGEKETNKEQKAKILKVGSITLMLITFVLLTINFPKYTLEENTYDDIRILSYRGFSEIEIDEDIISQTFTTNDTFNQIRIRLNNSDESTSSIYSLKLYNDETDELLYENTFDSKNVSDGSNKRFQFNEVNPKNNTRYRIELTKLEGSSTLSIGTYNESIYYKAYNNGSVYINNEETSDTFIFRVDERIERTYMSIPSCLILSAIILIGEYITLKEYILSKKQTKSLRKHR